jgi:hypothetical protein
MWLLDNSTPFAAERTWIRDAAGEEIWLVAIKATFEIDPGGRQCVVDEQEPVSRVPKFIGDPAKTSLIEECDFFPKKLRTDVLLKGHAYARHGQPTDLAQVRMKVGNVDKILNVFGHRGLLDGPMGPTPSAPRPFLKMEILYEKSFGGTDLTSEDPARHAWESTNPVGIGFGVRAEHVVGGLAPSIEYPDAPYSSHRHGRAAGFGPIARHWSPRLAFAGTYDETWENTRFPLPPADFKDEFYQCAPPDQQSQGLMQGYERVQLVNLTPQGYLEFVLPRVTFQIVTRFYRGADQNQRADLHTVRLIPDDRQFQMVWLSSLPCPYDEERLKGTTISVRKRIGVSDTTARTGVWVPG